MANKPEEETPKSGAPGVYLTLKQSLDIRQPPQMVIEVRHVQDLLQVVGMCTDAIQWALRQINEQRVKEQALEALRRQGPGMNH